MMRWNSAKTYTEEDMLRMQQEAMERVREFQQRSRATGGIDSPIRLPEPILQGETLALEPVETAPVEETTPPVIEGQAASPKSGNQPPAPLEGLLERLGLDGETALVLGIILLLYNEKADHLLLLALAYLLF